MAIKAAVIGTGLAGLSCAHTLRRAGWEVEAFEAEDHIGGRIATMRVGSASFDPGAQYVVPRTPAFADYLSVCLERGYAAEWHPRGAGDEAGAGRMATWYVGTPGMSSLLRPLTEGLRVFTRRPVHTVKRSGRTWMLRLEDRTSAGPYAAVALAVPPAEVMMLLDGLDIFGTALTSVRMVPCWSLQVVLDRQVTSDKDIHGDLASAIRWIARNNSKPRRPATPECLVVQASQAWSHTFENEDPEIVADELWGELCRLLSLPPSVAPLSRSIRLWKHGFATRHLRETYLYSTEHKLGAAGDWCRGRLTDHAFSSGVGLAKAILSSM